MADMLGVCVCVCVSETRIERTQQGLASYIVSYMQHESLLRLFTADTALHPNDVTHRSKASCWYQYILFLSPGSLMMIAYSSRKQ